MMEKVTTVFDAQIEAQGFEKIRSIVEIDLMNGQTLVQPSDDRYRGGPDRPFTRDELHAKSSDCAQLTMTAERIAKALAAIEGVQQMSSVRTLVAALAGSSCVTSHAVRSENVAISGPSALRDRHQTR